jgi:hypothetical protein
MMLGRSTYTSAEEQDTEVMASLFLERATRAATWPPRTQPEITASPAIQSTGELGSATETGCKRGLPRPCSLLPPD